MPILLLNCMRDLCIEAALKQLSSMQWPSAAHNITNITYSYDLPATLSGSCGQFLQIFSCAHKK
ncbi:unnamed protein product, partial [Ceratitis capitata]